MDPVLHEGEDDSEEEEEQCRRRKGAIMADGFEKETQRVKAKKRGKGGEVMMNVNGGGGRIVRATGRKDRHSKVCTARGTRDRRVRLSPNTAIQFYDVQDRLGYDRPSKAIDWLMKEAKAEIEALNNASINLTGLKEEEGNILVQNCSNNPSFSSIFPMESNNLHPNCVAFPEASSSSSSIFFFDDQRLISWNVCPENGKVAEEGSFTPAQNQVFSQREPLQSSFFPHSFSYAAAMGGGFGDNNELSGMSTAAAEEHHHLASGRPTTSLLDYHH